METKKLISQMNNHELLEYMIDFCKRYSNELNTVTTGNLSHRIGNLKHGLISRAHLVEQTMKKNDNIQPTIKLSSFEESNN